MATPVADGIAAADLLAAPQSVLRERNCVGFEIVEFDPERDRGPPPDWSSPWRTRGIAARRRHPAPLGGGFRRPQLCPLPVVLARAKGAGCST